MLLLAVAGVAMAHTPLTFLKMCPDESLHMHDVNVSQVHYFRLHPTCPIQLIQEGKNCQYETLSLHRFKHAAASVTVKIDGRTYHEQPAIESHIEPFTTTPSIKTLEISGEHGCNITLSTNVTSHIAFVSGKAEEPFLFLQVPWSAYLLQNSWAYTHRTDFWFWPFVGYGIFALVLGLWYDKPTLWVVALMWLYAATVDIIVPTARAVHQLGRFPGNGFWVGVFTTRLIAALVVLYAIVNNECSREYRPMWPWRWFGWLALWALITGVGFGGYVFVPVLFIRYGRTHKRRYKLVGYKVHVQCHQHEV